MKVLYIFLLAFIAVRAEEEAAEAPVDESLYDADKFAAEVAAKPHFVMFFAPWCGHCKKLKPTWEELGKWDQLEALNVAIAKVDCTLEKELCSNAGVMGYPTLKLFVDPGTEATRYKGARDLKSLQDFLTKELDDTPKPPAEAAVAEDGLYSLTADNFEEHVSKGYHFIKFYAPWCGHCKRLEPTWMDLAKAHSSGADDDVKIGRVDCTQHRAVCSDYEVRGYPTLLWLKDGKMVKKYASGRDMASLEKFAAAEMGKAPPADVATPPPPVQKPATPPPPKKEEPEPEEDSDVVTITDKNFEFETAVDATFVMFYAPWCGFCKRLHPTWEELASDESIDEFVDVTIAKVDCTQHGTLCQEHGVRGYPTLFFFMDGEKQEKYAGGRSLEEFKKYILEKTEAKYEAPSEPAAADEAEPAAEAEPEPAAAPAKEEL